MKIKKHFLLRDDLTFLNHGSFGACPKPVFEAYQNYQKALERDPLQFLERDGDEAIYSARKELGKFLNTKTENLVFVPNTTTGMNIIAKQFPFSRGDEVLTTNLEYGAIDRMWWQIAQEKDLKIRSVELPFCPQNDKQILNAIESGITKRTKIISFSHISSLSALVLPAKKIVALAKSKGIPVIVDGAHAPGQIPLDLKALSPDFYVGNCHKWLMAPKGSAFMFAKKKYHRDFRPLITSWGTKEFEFGGFIEENSWQGTVDPAAYLAVSDAIKFYKKYDWEKVRQRCHAQLADIQTEYWKLAGLPKKQKWRDKYFAQMICLPIDIADPTELQNYLRQKHMIEIPIRTVGTQHCIRVSWQGYNSAKDWVKLRKVIQPFLEKK